MLDKIVALLARQDCPVGELRAALPVLSTAQMQAESRVERLEAARKFSLIHGDMVAVSLSDHQIAQGNLEVERIATLIGEIETRLAGKPGGRLAQVLSLPEARGRHSLAQHLAEETDMSIEACRDLLAHAAIDESELAAGAVALYRSVGARAP